MAEDSGEVVALRGLVVTVASGGCWLLSRQERQQAAKLKVVPPLRVTGRWHNNLFPG